MVWRLFMIKKKILRKSKYGSVVYQKIETDFWKNFLLNLIKNHYKETSSRVASYILDNFDNELDNFYQVCPKEMLDKLKKIISKKNLIFKFS